MLTLTACASSTTGTTGTSGAASSTRSSDSTNEVKKPIEIEFWYAFGGRIEENNLELVRQFNEMQDEVIVIANSQGDYNELHAKTQAAFAAKNYPAVSMNEIASVGVFARSGMTQPLGPFAERDQVNIDDFIPGLMGNSYVDGELYALFYLRSTPILYMNVTMLKETGLDPTGPKTWTEFEEYARKLTIPGERVGMTMPISDWYYEAFVAQSGGQMISDDKKMAINSAAGIDPVKLWKKMSDEGIMKIPSTEDAGALASQDFHNQYSAMNFGSTAGLTHNLMVAEESGFELNVTFMPANVSYGVPTGGANLVMLSGMSEDKQEAAWKFIKWMTDTEQTAFASDFTGYLASRYSAMESDKMVELYNSKPQYKVAMDQLEYARARPMEDAYAEIRKIMIDEISKAILLDHVTPEAAISEIVKRADPENTMIAFEAAMNMGFTHLEIDVQLSQDGVPVVIHDNLLNRTSNGNGPVGMMSLDQLKRLDFGAGEKIPTLAEVLDLVKGQMIIDLELKQVGNLYPGIEQKVVEVLHENQMMNQVYVTSPSEK